jgi:hypothetical protein
MVSALARPGAFAGRALPARGWRPHRLRSGPVVAISPPGGQPRRAGVDLDEYDTELDLVFGRVEPSARSAATGYKLKSSYSPPTDHQTVGN